MPCFSFQISRNISGLLIGICALSLLTSCKKPEEKPAEKPPVKLEKPALRAAVKYADIPGWATDSLSEAWLAFMASCSKLESQTEWQEVCRMAKDIDSSDEQTVRTYFESNFTPFQLRNPDGSEMGLATGYYEPVLIGSRTQTARFNTPILASPDDLLSIELASVYPQLEGMRLRGRLEGNKVVPYFTREEITKPEKIANNVLLWVEDPVDAFFLQIQGSGRIQLVDSGETVRVAFADVNGHAYKSIGRYLVEKGELKLHQASAQGIKNWLKENPDKKDALFNVNPRYAFFEEKPLGNPEQGPLGALSVPLTPARSIAIDPDFVPLGAPIFLATEKPGHAPFLQQLVMAQDIGGAIKGGVRADYFWGCGKEAGEQAGRMKMPVNMWLLLPKKSPPADANTHSPDTSEKLEK